MLAAFEADLNQVIASVPVHGAVISDRQSDTDSAASKGSESESSATSKPRRTGRFRMRNPGEVEGQLALEDLVTVCNGQGKL